MSKALIHLCLQLKNARVLVIGDVMLDRYIYGSVDRISPESPVPVLSIARDDHMLGGAGNTLANLRGLGVQAEIIAIIGKDDHSRTIKEQIKAIGVNTKSLIRDGDRQTTVKNRYLAGHQQIMRADLEVKTPIEDSVAASILKQVEKKLGTTDAIILSDYGKGLLTPALIQDILRAANAKNIPVIVDPKGTDFSIYRGAYLITPNKKELAEASGSMPVKTDKEIIAACTHIMETCGIENILATRSADGLSWISADQNIPPYHVRSAKIDVFDVSGAGDTVIATVAAAIARKASHEAIADLANIAGSVAVTKVGTAPINIEDMYDAIDNTTTANNTLKGDSKLNDLQETIKRWRARGFTVGFTNGCFDIVHAGHVTYLHEAAQHCDKLIVGLNRDSSVRILKGKERPIHDEAARAAVLSGLASVDRVILFGAEKPGDDNTAIEVIKTLQPDIYFKGGDYHVDEIPETPTVRAIGGEVKVLSNIEGYSTSIAVEKIKKAS